LVVLSILSVCTVLLSLKSSLFCRLSSSILRGLPHITLFCRSQC
jgi:hypothetical protein